MQTLLSGSINCVALVNSFLNVVVYVHFSIQWWVSKYGNSALLHFGKCLLTVGGDEQEEIWLLTVADSEHTNFISGRIGAYHMHSDIASTFLYP